MAVDASGGARAADGRVRVQPGGGGRAVGGTRADRASRPRRRPAPVRRRRRRGPGLRRSQPTCSPTSACSTPRSSVRCSAGRCGPSSAAVRRADGTRSTSCYAGAADGPPAPLAAINVYRVRAGTPAEFVRAAGGRALPGAGRGGDAAGDRGRADPAGRGPAVPRHAGGAGPLAARRGLARGGAGRARPAAAAVTQPVRTRAVSAASPRTGPRPPRRRRRGPRWPPRWSASGPGRGSAA